MIRIRLSYNQGYKWFHENDIYVKGYILTPDNQVLRDETLVHYFASVETPEEFKTKLQQANGLFSVVVQRGERLFAAVDNVRAFPLFYYQRDGFFAVTDSPDELTADDVPLSIDEDHAVILGCAGFVTGNKTLLKNVFQLVAGEYLYFEDNTLKKDFHTQFLTNDFFSLSREELKTELKKVIDKMGKNLVKILDNRPVVIPLSGGFDSRLLAYLLRKNNYDNVLCYTFGAAGNSELHNARATAERLGYEWIFVEYNEFYNEKMNQNPVFKEYTHFSGCYSSQLAEQDFFALQRLFSLNKIAESSVFIPGHSGAIAGSWVKKEMTNPDFSYVDYVLETIFSQVLLRKKERRIIQSEIDFLDDSEQREAYPPYLIYENWRFQEAASKFLHNCAKIWDFFGYEYLLPLWDSALFDFFVKVPLSHKYDKNLYKETVSELFAEYDIFFHDEEMYPSEKLLRKVFFRSMLKKKFPILKKFINIWKTDRTGAEFYMKSFVEELKKEGCYRKMLHVNGILSAWYLLEARKRINSYLCKSKSLFTICKN
ncbi:MAG: asparagine synthase-related protein [Bacteroidales bacterium]|nr:asparagine synthase-related protein [Bacteroidales bacterium]